MKQSIIIIATVTFLAGIANGLYAQRPVGDTLTNLNQDRSYYIGPYSWSTSDTSISWSSFLMDGMIYSINGVANLHCCQITECDYRDRGNYIKGVQLTTTRPIKVLGVAACAYMPDTSYQFNSGLPFTIDYYIDPSLSTRITDSLILYRLTPTGPEWMAAGPWRMEYPHRNITLPPYDSRRVPCVNSYVLDTLPPPVGSLYEVMFDKPQVVTDTFIVAGTAKNNTTAMYYPDFGAPRCKWEHRPTRYWNILAFTEQYNPDICTWLWAYNYHQWYRRPEGPPHPINPITYREYPVIVPIFDPNFDTVLCDMVRDIRVAEATDTTITLMWNGGNAVQWEVEYAEATGTSTYSVTTTSPMVTLTGLRASTTYLGHVRAMCEWDTEYGPWSDFAEMATGAHQQPHTTGITDNLDRFTQLMPNPAREVVTVLSSYRLGRVAVYDLQGRKVLEQQEDEALAATLDISTLPAGVYVVAIHTPAGIATKRLLVGSEK